MARSKLVDFVLEGEGPNLKFVEIEDMDGCSINVGESIDKGDGYTRIRVRIIEEEDWMELAREEAAQCWCDNTTKDADMDLALVEVIARKIYHWIEIAAFNDKNTDYYRGLLDECAKHLGPEVFVCDDGSISEDPLRAKIPSLVSELMTIVSCCTCIEERTRAQCAKNAAVKQSIVKGTGN